MSMSLPITTNTLNSLRQEHESESEWRLRSQFLRDNDSLPQDRLVCLSHCFINIVVYNCSYPPAVMAEVHRRGKHLVEDRVNKCHPPSTCSSKSKFSPRKKQPLFKPKYIGIKFVPACESSSLENSNPASENHDDPCVSAESDCPSSLPSNTNILSSERGNENQLGNLEIENPVTSMSKSFSVMSQNRQGNYQSAPHIVDGCGDSINRLSTEQHDSTNDQSRSIDSNKSSKKKKRKKGKSAKTLSASSSSAGMNSGVEYNEPFSSCPNKNEEREEKVFSRNSHHAAYCGPRETRTDLAGQKRHHKDLSQSNKFIIMEAYSDTAEIRPADTLAKSAALNQQVMDWDISETGGSGYKCCLLLGGKVLADVTGPSQSGLKSEACSKALELLKKTCWTIKTKVVDLEKRVSKDQILSSSSKPDVVSEDNAISSSNVGNKLMQRMGWSGGGLGKDNSGIVEPVSLQRVFNREGLGLTSASFQSGGPDQLKQFQFTVRTLIRQFTQSSDQQDLVFSAELKKCEREVIHKACQKYPHLRTISRGKSSSRYLVVSKKKSADQLFHFLQSVGGETECYRLVPPGVDVSAN